MEEAISRIITELVEISRFDGRTNPQSQPPSLSEHFLLDLQLLVDNTNDSEAMDSLYEELSSKSLYPSALIHPIASAMDSGSTHLSLLAAKVFLSLLLSPNAPVLTLFTPMSFLSFLRSIRQSFKHRTEGHPGPDEQSHGSQTEINRKRKVGGRGRVSRKNARNSQNNDNVGEESEVDLRVLFSLLERLELVMGLIHLDRFPDCLKSLIQTMAKIPVISLDLWGNLGSYNKLTSICSRVLGEVLQPEHGDPANTAAEVLKSLSSLILMPKSQARTFSLGFVTNQMMAVAREFDEVKKAVVNLPRYLVQKAPEKSELRALAVESIMEIVGVMEYKDQIRFVQYVVKMTQGKVSLRLLAVDLILTLVMSLKDPLGVNSEAEMKDSWGIWCLEALIQRCSDVSAGIRARSLSNLAQLVGFLSGDGGSRVCMKEVMGFGKGGHNVEASMNGLLRKRCMDEKAAVRKAALLLVTKLTALLGGTIDGMVLKSMSMACSDPLVSIRKAAIAALSEAFRKFSDETVTTEWLHSVPRLISDNESSIQEECENLFLELVLDRISRAGSADISRNGSIYSKNLKAKSLDRDMEMFFPEGVLYLLKGICNGEVTPWVKKICTNLGKKKRLKHKIAIALQNIIRASESLWLSHSMPIENWMAPPGVWFLLSEVSVYLPKVVDWEFLHHHWQFLDKYGMEGECKSSFVHGEALDEEDSIECNSIAWAGDRVFLLQTIANVAVELPAEAAADLAHNLLKRIEEFNMHLTEVKAHVKALTTLCKRKASNLEEAEALVLKWVHQVLSKASQILEKCISEDLRDNKNSNFLTPPRSLNRKDRRSVVMSRLLSEAIAAVYSIGSLVIVCPSADTTTIIPLLYTIITSGNPSSSLNKLPGPRISLKQTAPSLYIQAWLTMGKLCLADGKLAKNYIPLFVQELEKSDSAALRNNLIVIMADFCVRYTALVDCYTTKITKCLRDPCELVRRQTFILLARLLQRDYVKWRGVMFLRFLLSLVDESEKIRQLADFLFGNILKVKAPLLAYNSFVEAIFVLNDCHAHNAQSDSHGSRTESQLFSIRGNDEKAKSQRMHIYVSLLKQMAPEHLLATFAKLCAEILAAASDGLLNVGDVTGQSVLQDVFHILSCKEIRISSTRASSSEAADIEEEGDGGGASVAAARGRAITQAVRKGLIQNTIPIFIELKRLLESKNSPLIGSLMECLRILLKDYKNEIDDILVADQQLQKELIYDMQKYETAKAKVTAAEAVATMQKSSSYQSPGVPDPASKTQGQSKLKCKLVTDSKVASAMADAAAAATARSVLKEVNKGIMASPLSSLRVPKAKSCRVGSSSGVDRPVDVLESLRRRQSFDSDEEN
ncbi:Condensin-2 complex subunit D3 [Quillaja saponaria]|uniref:Condensin-2 complex subunit D3 n=1 Tax=Quillaja saponaria TaxID=32244 RepID=A0AAD7QG88_QUISA|nr:Condensin-2 complex subunit D3 [Quillaja saponaria]